MHDITATIYWKANKKCILKNIRNAMKWEKKSLVEAMKPTLEHIEHCFDNNWIWRDTKATLEFIQSDIYRSI